MRKLVSGPTRPELTFGHVTGLGFLIGEVRCGAPLKWPVPLGDCVRLQGVLWTGRATVKSLKLSSLPLPFLLGPPAAPVRGCGCHETLQQGQGQCQPPHLPPQQEVLAEVTEAMGATQALISLDTFLNTNHYSASLQTPRAQDWTRFKEPHLFPSWKEFAYLATNRVSNWLKPALPHSRALRLLSPRTLWFSRW